MNLAWAVPLGERILKRFYARCVEVYAPSESMADLIREKGLAENIHLWTRGVDRALFHPGRRDMEWRRGLGIADTDVVIAFVGRLVLEKGLDVLAATAAELDACAVPHRILVVGDGPAREWIEERLPSAIFLGFQSGPDLARAYASADIFFNPSSTETFGQVTMEAMASALPVVGARAGGTINLVEDGVSGLLTAPDDAAESAEAIARFIADPAFRASAGARGLAHAAEHDWETVNQAVLDRYLTVVENWETRVAA